MKRNKEADDDDDEGKRRAGRRTPKRRSAPWCRPQRGNLIRNLQRSIKELSDRSVELKNTNNELRARLEVILHEKKLSQLCAAPASHHHQQQQQPPPNIVVLNAATTTPHVPHLLTNSPLTTLPSEMNPLSLSGPSTAGVHSSEAVASMEHGMMLQFMAQDLSTDVKQPSGSTKQSVQADFQNGSMSSNQPTIFTPSMETANAPFSRTTSPHGQANLA